MPVVSLFNQSLSCLWVIAVMTLAGTGLKADVPCPQWKPGSPVQTCGFPIELKHSFWRQNYIKVQLPKGYAGRRVLLEVVLRNRNSDATIPTDPWRLEQRAWSQINLDYVDKEGIARFPLWHEQVIDLQDFSNEGSLMVLAELTDEESKANLPCERVLLRADLTLDGIVGTYMNGRPVAQDFLKNVLVNRMRYLQAKGKAKTDDLVAPASAKDPDDY